MGGEGRVSFTRPNASQFSPAFRHRPSLSLQRRLVQSGWRSMALQVRGFSFRAAAIYPSGKRSAQIGWVPPQRHTCKTSQTSASTALLCSKSMETAPVIESPAKAHLSRRFGLLSATALNMTNMIGIGPFFTIPLLMTELKGPQAMIGWGVALLVAICDGMIWSELGAAFPGSGGSYLYLKEGFGPRTFGRMMAFLFIWQFILSGPLEIASGYVGFLQYLKYLWPAMNPWVSGGIIVGVGLLTVGLLYRKISGIEKITIALWIGTLLTIGAVIFTGLGHFNAKIAFDFAPDSFQFSFGFLFGLGAASRIGVYDYLGYYDICYIGDEVREPGRVIPRSIITSVLLVALIYVGINLSIIGIVPWREFVPAGDPPAPVASLMMQKIHGTRIAVLFTVMVLWTALGSVFALLLGYSPIPCSAAKEGHFFKIFARLHPKKNFPHVSLLLMGLISILF